MKVHKVGTSDPVSFNCICPAQSNGGGSILLFYRYFAAPPSLPKIHTPRISDLEQLAAFHRDLCEKLHLGGKIRIATEGFNITVGGTKDEIEIYMESCTLHWSFDGLDLDTREQQEAFFKPSAGGCACAFEGASVRVAAEITPLGVTNYVPSDWDIVKSLTPAEFHEKCWKDEKKVLVDVRNHYESRIGYFVDPKTREKAITPEVRRFSQFPLYVKTHMSELETKATDAGTEKGRNIMTYCTGGIRCEKGVRWMAEKMEQREGDVICTLKGGISAYLAWMDKEIKAGRKCPNDSLFHGKNYVFDARGSIGLEESEGLEPVSSCHVCGIRSDRLSKCCSKRCHLVLVVCAPCEESTRPVCCQSCRDLDSELALNATNLPRSQKPICVCELEREARLWGDRPIQSKKLLKRGDEFGGVHDIKIQVKTID